MIKSIDGKMKPVDNKSKEDMDEIFKKKLIGRPVGSFEDKQKQYMDMLNKKRLNHQNRILLNITKSADPPACSPSPVQPFTLPAFFLSLFFLFFFVSFLSFSFLLPARSFGWRSLWTNELTKVLLACPNASFEEHLPTSGLPRNQLAYPIQLAHIWRFPKWVATIRFRNPCLK